MKSGSIAIVLTAAAAVFVVAAGAAVSAGQGLFSSDGDGAVWVVEEDDGAYLGVRLREETDHPEGGALVTRVLEDSPAARAGLEQGDIILQFDDEVIRGPAALTKRIRSKEAGDRVSLTVQRDGDRQVLDVELGARSEGLFPGPKTFSFKSGDWQEVQEDLEDRMAEVRERLGEDGLMRWNFEPGQQFDVAPGFRFHWGRPRLGVQLIETTPELRQHLGADAAAGVLVSKVLVGTPAEHAGIAVGDLIVEVDGKSIGNTGDLVEALAEKVGETFTIRLIRDNDEKSVEVTLPEQDDEPVTGPRARAPRPRSSARHVAPMPVPLPAAPAPVRAPAAVAPPAPAAVAPPAPAAVAPPAPAMPPAPPAPPAPSSARRFV